ncbi:MAG: YbaK/EbsC family protein [Clostridiales bacterium]|jgi:prolyl-tRNA editing enzyme YbaK/EbsC (Cys-tRNA(Pro) deacylase)|nr:YbaK/EbsC family protein [Clostridiales bacterium]
MSYENVQRYFDQAGLGERVKVLKQSSATVELAAQAIGCQEKQIAKTLSFLVDEAPILIVAAGHVKVDNKKYKAVFHQRPKMIPRDLVEDRIGHGVGGVCPFAVKPEVTIYLDASLKGSEVVYPAAGSECSVVQLSLEELERCTGNPTWVDVCKE